MTGPFGETITGNTNPNNTVSDASWSYVGQHEKLTETSVALTPIQMGARIYIPTLGRFGSVDPFMGGTENNYVYPSDPVNDFDLTGLCWNHAPCPSVTDLFSRAGKTAIQHPIGQIFIISAAIALCPETAGAGCAVAAGAAAGAGVNVASSASKGKTSGGELAKAAGTGAIQGGFTGGGKGVIVKSLPKLYKALPGKTKNKLNHNNILRISQKRISIGGSKKFNSSKWTPYHIEYRFLPRELFIENVKANRTRTIKFRR